jgi:hypothetical protein
VTDARADISGNCGAGIRADGFIIAEKSQYGDGAVTMNI